KGYDYGLEAIALLRDVDVYCEYRIIGDGEYLEALAFAAHQLGLTGVEFMGATSRVVVREQMRRADVLLHSAVSEGFCNAVTEAASMCLPVVCSDADGLPENVLDGITGFIVPRRDPRSLSERIVELAESPELRQRMGCAARQRVLTRFRLEDQITAFSDLYEDVLSLRDLPGTEARRSVFPRQNAAFSGTCDGLRSQRDHT